jgi:hypothetical protein
MLPGTGLQEPVSFFNTFFEEGICCLLVKQNSGSATFGTGLQEPVSFFNTVFEEGICCLLVKQNSGSATFETGLQEPVSFFNTVFAEGICCLLVKHASVSAASGTFKLAGKVLSVALVPSMFGVDALLTSCIRLSMQDWHEPRGVGESTMQVVAAARRGMQEPVVSFLSHFHQVQANYFYTYCKNQQMRKRLWGLHGW